MLAHFCKKGTIERVERGLYRVTSASSGISLDFEELILTASSIPKGVICLISALCYYHLTDQIMREYWIAIPNTDKSPKRPHIRIVRMRNMSLGLTNIKVGKYRVKIFDRERTVVDAFRYLSNEIAIKALQAYLKPSAQKKVDLPKLSRYANALRINISTYIVTLTT
jgi:predicted transcriptional regulator of viral defense system